MRTNSFFRCLFAYTILAPASAYASGAGHHPGVASLAWAAINFCLFVAVVLFLYRRYGSPALKARSIAISEFFHRAEGVLRQAQAEFDELQGRMSAIASEKQQIHEHFARETQKLIQLVSENTKLQEAELLAATERRIGSESRAATRELHKEVVLRATQLAREEIRKTVSVEKDREIRSRALESVRLN